MFRIQIKLKIYDKEPVFGPGLVTLLENVSKTGSVKEACTHMKMSYSKGWKIINRAEESFKFTLIERQHGGKSGGSCKVTEKGQQMISRYLEMEREVHHFAEEKFKFYFPEYEE